MGVFWCSLIDEIQRVPELLLAIKREVDRDTRPGRYLLTGSARSAGASAVESWFMSTGENDADVVRRYLRTSRPR